MNYYGYLSNVAFLKLQSLPANSPDNPIIIEQCRYLAIDFQSSPTKETIDNSIKLYKIDTYLNKKEIPLQCTLDKSNPHIINIHLKNKALLDEGQEYMLRISLASGYKCIYLAVDYIINLKKTNIFNNEPKRKLILCISDIHLSMDDSYGQFKENRRYLHNFLSKLRFSPNLKEIIFNGDLFDEWFIPGKVKTLKENSPLYFLETVVKNNQEIINDINNILADKQIKVTYIPGNHDMLFNTTEINSILPGINQARDAFGLGSYTPEDIPNSIIEHGHRYDFFCAPNHLLTTNDDYDFLLPSGYFYARIAATSFVENTPSSSISINKFASTHNIHTSKNYLDYLYKIIYTYSLKKCPVKESKDEKFLYTHLNGYKEIYSINDIFPDIQKEDTTNANNLFKDITYTWNERQKLNKVAIMVPTEEAIKYSIYPSYYANMAQIQYFKNPDSKKRIVILGHTHYACMNISNNTKKQRTIYANCGSWLDKSFYPPSMTFILLIPHSRIVSPLTFVHLYRYKSDNSIEKLHSQVITEFTDK